LDLGEEKQHEDGENIIMKRFITWTLHKIFVGSSDQEG
jgi:hypothetical protein